MVDLDGNGITDLYFDVNYSEDETFKILIIEGLPKNDEIDTSNLYGMDDLIDGTYVQIKESLVKSLLSS